MQISETAIPGVLLLQPEVHADARGVLFESHRTDVLAARGIPAFVQDNQVHSVPATLRGLHYQLSKPQGKLIRALAGEVYDVAVDIRIGSRTFGKWVGASLSAENRTQIYIPPGFAHGFCVVGDAPAEVLYRCTDYYSGAADQYGVVWDDPAIGIPWPVAEPLLSDRDRSLMGLKAARNDLPTLLTG